MSEIQFDTVVMGATFLGVGCALASPRALIVDRRMTVGHDFIDCLREARVSDAPFRADGARFLAELARRGLAGPDGWLFAAPCAYLLSRALTDAGTRYWPATVLTGARRIGSGFLLKFFGPDGEREVRAGRWIDASADLCAQYPFSRRLNCAAHAEGHPPKDAFTFNPRSGLLTFGIPMTPGESLSSARARLLAKWREEKYAEAGNRISLIAPTPAYEAAVSIVQALPDGRLWAPSCACADAVHAFDEGARLAKEAF